MNCGLNFSLQLIINKTYVNISYEALLFVEVTYALDILGTMYNDYAYYEGVHVYYTVHFVYYLLGYS